MRLFELTGAGDSKMALLKLALATRELRIVINQANKDLDEALKYNDPGMLLPSIGPVASWFKDNYLSAKGKSGHNINSILNQLSKEKAFAEPAQRALKNINIVAGRNLKQFGKSPKSKPKEKAKSNMDNLSQLVDSFTDIFDKAPSTHLRSDQSQQIATASKGLQQEFGATRGKVSELMSIPWKERGIDDKKASADREAEKEIRVGRGQQRAKADQVVNQVLSTLPDQEIANKIRHEISRADNKLQALHMAMKKYGLAESVKYFKRLLRENALI